MKKCTFHILPILLCLLTIQGCSQTHTPLVSVIFDTDMGPDYDDVGALTLLHALADNGEARILATISSNRYAFTVPCIDVINHYYGRPDIPIGAPLDGVDLEDEHPEKWAEALPAAFEHRYKTTAQAQDAVQLYRRILAQEPDHSVVIVTVGFLTNLAALLKSPPDQHSNLTGKELVKKKVSHLVSMAGRFPKGREYNVYIDTPASIVAFNEWPTSVILSGFEIGKEILTGKRLIASDIPDTPAKVAYTICLRQGDPYGRMSWDQTAVLVAVRGTEPYFGTQRGKMVVASDGSNTWEEHPNGPHQYLTWKMAVEPLTTIIEDLMMHP